MERLFLVKSIGDELWYIIELEDNDAGLAYSTISALQSITSYVASLSITSEHVEFQEQKEDDTIWDRIRYARLNLAFKAYADVMEDCHNFTGERVDFIVKALRNLTGIDGKPRFSQDGFNQLIANVSGRLNIGELSADNELKLKGIRYDPIGTDVDLFFRTSKHALPGLTTIGESFVTKFAGFDSNRICLIEGDSTRQSYHYFPFLKTVLTPDKLKGTGRSYTVYSLLSAQPDALFSRAPTDPEPDPVKETRDRLVTQGFLIVSENPDLDKYKKDGWTFYKRNPELWPNRL